MSGNKINMDLTLSEVPFRFHGSTEKPTLVDSLINEVVYFDELGCQDILFRIPVCCLIKISSEKTLF